MKRIKLLLKILALLVVAVAVLIGLSIPIASMSEGMVENPGKSLHKVVFRHANIITLDTSRVLYNHALFIDKSKVVAVLPDSLADTSGYAEINASGQYMLPGLVDLHVHVFDRSDLTNYLGYGVTHVRNMMGFPMHLRWKEQWEANRFPGSKMITASPTLNAGDGTDPFHNTLSDEDNVEAILKKYKEKEYDFFKIYDGISEEQFVTIMKSAKVMKMPVAGHAPISVPRSALLHSGLASFEHIEEVYNNYLQRKQNDSLALVIAHEFAAAQKPVCVTLSAYHHIYLASNHKEDFLQQTPYEQINPLLIFIGNRLLSDYLNPSEKLQTAVAAKRAYLSKLTRMFYDAGVPLMFGTDTGPNLTVPGYTVHEELQLLKETGIPIHHILRSATIDAMRFLNDHQMPVGFTAGAEADLLVVRNNPLDDLSTLKNPMSILSNGVFYDSSAVRQLRTLGKDKSGKYVSMGNLLQQFLNK